MLECPADGSYQTSVASEDFRAVQFTSPGSECSIIFGKGVTSAVPGSTQDLQLTVFDIEAARAELVGRGVDVREPWHGSEAESRTLMRVDFRGRRTE